MSLPWADPEVFHPGDPQPRTQALVYADKYLKSGGKLSPAHQELGNLAQTAPDAAARAQVLRGTRVLYCYEPGVMTAEAMLCGCPVVYMQNDRTLSEPRLRPAHAGRGLGRRGHRPGAGARRAEHL
jgi:hypothetical protein